jgi:hypothetical protein
MSCWSDIPTDSPDISGIQLQGSFGTLLIINAYIDCDSSEALHTIHALLQRVHAGQGIGSNTLPLLNPINTSFFFLGDFNRHHPFWEEEQNSQLFSRRALGLARPLLNIISTFGLLLTLPKGVPTLEQASTKNWTWPDNVFVSLPLLGAVIRCDVDPGHRPPKADHPPILTTLDLETHTAPKTELATHRLGHIPGNTPTKSLG